MSFFHDKLKIIEENDLTLHTTDHTNVFFMTSYKYPQLSVHVIIRYHQIYATSFNL